MFENQKPSRIYQVTIGGVVIVGLLAWFFLMSPQLAASSEDSASAEATKQTVAMVEDRISLLSRRVQDADESIERINTLTRAFPNTYKQDEFIALIAAAAKSAGVSVETISTTQPADPESFDDSGQAKGESTAGVAAQSKGSAAPEGAIAATGSTAGEQATTRSLGESVGDFPLAQVNVTLTVSGSAVRVQRFVERLASLSRPFLVDSVALKAGPDGATADLSGRTFLSRPLEVPDFD